MDRMIMNLTAKQKECLEVMENASFVELTTIDNQGFPSTRAMLNLRNKQQYPKLLELYSTENNPLTVYLTTNTSSEKMREITGNKKSCLYFCQPESFHGILLQGTIEQVTDKAFKQKVWQDGWEIYYPDGEEDYSVLRFVPDKLKTYADFQVDMEKI
ncbi:MAG: pyridoxamine 5'-phosphate oxidase family protein [Dysgonamonadaceae bacterium]|jgi:general stress protein 26|nr:pyridoxamine 5'-phosphate oxidase family protein [Dysgonamonadaceae bacterium]